MKERFLVWFQEKKERLGLALIVLLVGILCFEAGLIQGAAKEQAPLILSVPEAPVSVEGSATETRAPAASSRMEPVVAVEEKTGSCIYVGSKNSDKYHLASCAVAKRIKPENRLCFASREEAEKRGYVPSCLK